MGDVRGEFALHLLGLRALRGVERHQRHAQDRAVRFDTATLDLIDALAAVELRRAASGGERVAHGAGHRHVAAHGHEIAPHAVLAGVKQAHGGGVDAQHMAVRAQQHKPFLHAVRDGGKFVLPALQLGHLRLDAPVLLIDAPKQRRKLLVGVVVQRVHKVERIERRDDALRQAPRQQHARRDGRQQYGEERLHRAQRHGQYRVEGGGNAQHAAVAQPPRQIERLFGHRGRIALALAAAGAQRVRDFAAGQVVVHVLGAGLGIEQHAAVGGHPGDAAGRVLKAFEVVQPVALDGRGGQIQLGGELLPLQCGEIAVLHRDHGDEAADEHDHGGQQDRPENFLGHTPSSIR